MSQIEANTHSNNEKKVLNNYDDCKVELEDCKVELEDYIIHSNIEIKDRHICSTKVEDRFSRDEIITMPTYKKKLSDNLSDFERFIRSIQNPVTGLRYPTEKRIRPNTTIYYYLRYKTKNIVPLDGIMCLINECLNWIPVIYYQFDIFILSNNFTSSYSCRNCKSPYWINIKGIPYYYCSYECFYMYIRSIIIEDYKIMDTIMDLFKHRPLYCIDWLKCEMDRKKYNYKYLLEKGEHYDDSDDYCWMSD